MDYDAFEERKRQFYLKQNKLEYKRIAKIKTVPGDNQPAEYTWQDRMYDQRDEELEDGFQDFFREIDIYLRNHELVPPNHGPDDINLTERLVNLHR